MVACDVVVHLHRFGHLAVRVQTRDNVEQLRFVAPPVSLLAKREPVAPARDAAATPRSAGGGAAVAPAASGAARVSLVRGHSASIGRHSAAAAVSAAAAASSVPQAGAHSANNSADGAAALDQGGPAEPTTWLSPEYYSSPPGDTCVSLVPCVAQQPSCTPARACLATIAMQRCPEFVADMSSAISSVQHSN